MKIENDFRRLRNLRWKLDEDGTAIATSFSRARRLDKLYFYGPGKVGLYVERGTRQAFQAAVRWYSKCSKVLEAFLGDFDGILVLDAGGPLPRCFFRSARGNFSGRGWFSCRVSGPSAASVS